MAHGPAPRARRVAHRLQREHPNGGFRRRFDRGGQPRCPGCGRPRTGRVGWSLTLNGVRYFGKQVRWAPRVHDQNRRQGGRTRNVVQVFFRIRASNRGFRFLFQYRLLRH
ncbi:MAG: hypothetical protein E6G66_10840 [Actinobacteria bacterium]|nr:MAG: hypothetical protein E6G66_10840 [Actinomycetota bacterium]